MGRSLISGELREKESHGMAYYADTSSDIGDAKVINIRFSFEEAIKLSVAIQSAVLELNRLDRRTSKNIGMNLCLKPDAKSATAIVSKIPESKPQS